MKQAPVIVDLFSGCGGFGLGAELAGFHSAVAVDIDATLQSAYQLNFPSTRAIQADVSRLGKSAWRFLLKDQRPDGVIGGPPCQGFSRIGKREDTDPRNTLIGHFFEQVGLLDPNFFIMENVDGLLDERTVDVLMSALEPISRRYKILDPIIVNAADYGAATNRTRVVVIGYNPLYIDPLSPSDFYPAGDLEPTTVKDAIFDLKGPIKRPKGTKGFVFQKYKRIAKANISAYAKHARQMPAGLLGDAQAKALLKKGLVSGFEATEHSDEVKARFAQTKQGAVEPISRYPKLHWQGSCPTLRAGTGSDKGSYQAMRPLHPTDVRVISVREAARLQGFPDWFQFHPTKWHSFRMIGNSVSPIMSKALLSAVIAKMHLKIAA